MGDRAVRLPLSLGVTCLTDLAVGVIAVPTGIAVTIVALALLWWGRNDSGDGLKVYLGLIVFGGGTTYLGARAAVRAWRYRPSDLVIEERGVRIVGGGRHGFTAAWAGIAQTPCEVKTSERMVITIRGLIAALFESDLDEHFYRFHLGSELVAETDSLREADSFREIAAAMAERASPPTDADLTREVVAAAAHEKAAHDDDDDDDDDEHDDDNDDDNDDDDDEPMATDRRARKRHRDKARRHAAAETERATAAARRAAPTGPAPEIAIVTCAGCGAAVAPCDADEAVCAYCATRIPIPAELRVRVRAVAHLTAQARRAEGVVVKLLDQPSARATTKWIAASTVFIVAAWPLSVGMYVDLARAHRLTVELGVCLAALPFLLVLDGFFLSRLRLVDRVALRSLALTFAARAPAREGGPPGCRACLGPLPALTTTVIDCAYCGAANVTRVDLRGRARKTELSAASLEQALRGHQRERLGWRLATIVGAACFAATGLLLHHVLR